MLLQRGSNKTSNEYNHPFWSSKYRLFSSTIFQRVVLTKMTGTVMMVAITKFISTTEEIVAKITSMMIIATFAFATKMAQGIHQIDG